MKRTKKAKLLPYRPAPDTRPRSKCPLCGTWIVSDQMDAHMRVIHFRTGYRVYRPTAPEQTRPTPPSVVPEPVPTTIQPPQRPIISCPECGVSVQARRLENHLRKVHGRTDMPQNIQPPAPPMTTCPYCRVPIHVQRLEQHLDKVHHRASIPQNTDSPAPRPRNEPPEIITSPPVSIKRTGVFIDDETLSVEVDGTFIGTAGNVREGWEMIAEYKRRHSS